MRRPELSKAAGEPTVSPLSSCCRAWTAQPAGQKSCRCRLFQRTEIKTPKRPHVPFEIQEEKKPSLLGVATFQTHKCFKDKNRLSSLSGQRKSLEQGSHVCLFVIRDIFPIPCSLEATQDWEGREVRSLRAGTRPRGQGQLGKGRGRGALPGVPKLWGEDPVVQWNVY